MDRRPSYLIILLLLLLAAPLHAALFQQSEEFLQPDEAFQLTVEPDNSEQIELNWIIAPGYYLYRSRIHASPVTEGISFAPLQLPDGIHKHDEYFGDVEIYEQNLQTFLQVDGAKPGQTVQFEVGYQGCAHAGLCYTPTVKSFQITWPSEGISAAAGLTSNASPLPNSVATPAMVTEQDQFAQKLASGKVSIIAISFFVAGLLLAFTPCVFPMIPILSSIIIGEGENTNTRRAFMLSLVYVLAMALTYTIVGVLMGLFGQSANLQIWFQDPVVIGIFAAIFVLLALSMFGLYELQMPAFVQSKLNEISGKQKGGTLIGAGVMGFLSALIVGPCVTAPLIGALIYISQQGSAFIGGLALFSLSIGMGAPLLLIGTSAGKLLPRSGQWMTAVKSVFGVLLIALAIWLLDRVVPSTVILFLSGSLLVFCAIYLGALSSFSMPNPNGWLRFRQGLGWLSLVYGVILLIGASAGSGSLTKPLTFASMQPIPTVSSSINPSAVNFQRIKTVADVERAIQVATQQGKPVVLDFYADWCVACKEMEHFTFSDPQVASLLGEFITLQADITANDAEDQALMARYSVFAPPVLLFFNTAGEEMKNFHVVGFKSAKKMVTHIEHFNNQQLVASR